LLLILAVSLLPREERQKFTWRRFVPCAGAAVLVFYLAVINPRYMGRKLWWRRTKRKQ